MIYRRPTLELQKLVAPGDLENILGGLKNRGILTSYKVGVLVTTLRVSKGAEIGWLLEEESSPRPNPRPYVARKKNDDN